MYSFRVLCLKSFRHFLIFYIVHIFIIILSIFSLRHWQDLVTYASLWRHGGYQGVTKQAAVAMVWRCIIQIGSFKAIARAISNLTHWGRVTHICISKIIIIGSDIVYWTLRIKLQWNLNRKSYIFIQKNVFENVVCNMASISSRHQWINTSESA